MAEMNDTETPKIVAPVFGGGAREIIPFVKDYTAYNGVKDYRPIPQPVQSAAEDTDSDPKVLSVAESASSSLKQAEDAETVHPSQLVSPEQTVPVEKVSTPKKANIAPSKQTSS
jgi:hypothetical protein